MELKWMGKERRRNFGKHDISIALSKNGNYRERTTIRFRNNTIFRICKNGYIVYAVFGKRIYFKESNENIGYKLTTWSDDMKSCSIQFVGRQDEFVGDYDLLYDKDEKLYYIDSTKKKIGE